MLKIFYIAIISMLILGCKEDVQSDKPKLLDNIEREEYYELIDAKDLHLKMSDKYPIQIIATMPRGIYILGFINGAKNFTFNNQFTGIWRKDTINSKQKFIDFMGDKNKTIIFYDSNDGSAKVASTWAHKLGYQNVYVLSGGFQKWKESGFEISTDMPKCCQMDNK